MINAADEFISLYYTIKTGRFSHHNGSFLKIVDNPADITPAFKEVGPAA